MCEGRLLKYLSIGRILVFCSGISDYWESKFGVKELGMHPSLRHFVVLNLAGKQFNNNCQYSQGTFLMPGTRPSPLGALL